MKKLRFLSLLLLSVAMVVLFASCGSDKEPSLYQPGAVNPSTPAATEPPATPAPTTAAPTTEAPTTEAPTTEAPEVGDPLEVGAKWYVNADKLNIRSGPSTDTEAVAALYRGEQILILSIQGEWLEVMSSAGNGFVHSGFVVSTYKETGLSGSAPKDEEEVPAPQSEAPTAPPATQAPASNTNGHVVCIDAGHQQAGISEQEPNGPGSTVMKAKLTTGTQGCATGIPEHQINLQVSLLLKQELINRGYRVVMIRETADCPQSNAERAQVANSSGAEIFVRIHCNSSNNADVTGAQFYSPSLNNPYMSDDLVNACNNLSAVMLDSFCAATGAINRGVLQDDGMTGINWCTVPVTIAEMGFMSNPNEDRLLADPSYQAKMVQGMANGIDRYFGR